MGALIRAAGVGESRGFTNQAPQEGLQNRHCFQIFKNKRGHMSVIVRTNERLHKYGWQAFDFLSCGEAMSC